MAQANGTKGGPTAAPKTSSPRKTLPRQVALRALSPDAPVFETTIELRCDLTIAGLLALVPPTVTNRVFAYGRIVLPLGAPGWAEVPSYFLNDEELNRSLGAVELHSAPVERVALYLNAPGRGDSWSGKSLEHRAADVAKARSVSNDRRRQ